MKKEIEILKDKIKKLNNQIIDKDDLIDYYIRCIDEQDDLLDYP